MELRPVFRSVWSEMEGCYLDTQGLLGYEAIGADGKAVAVGETAAEAIQAAWEVLWPTPSNA